MELTNKAILSFILSLVFFCAPQVQARSYHSYDTASPSFITVAELPSQARDTLRLIYQGGPFPYPRDGIVFGNRERQLPAQSRGCTSDTLLTKSADCGRRCEAGAPALKGSAPPCRVRYREYTVKTPGVHSRGARRIVCGVLPECYYTDDHYQSFKRIKE
jgi:ribonuclease T1